MRSFLNNQSMDWTAGRLSISSAAPVLCGGNVGCIPRKLFMGGKIHSLFYCSFSTCRLHTINQLLSHNSTLILRFFNFSLFSLRDKIQFFFFLRIQTALIFHSTLCLVWSFTLFSSNFFSTRAELSRIRHRWKIHFTIAILVKIQFFSRIFFS